MADGEKNTIKRFGEGLKSEFGKIIWPEPETVGKQSTAVIIISVLLALIIVLIDMVVQQGVDILVNL